LVPHWQGLKRENSEEVGGKPGQSIKRENQLWERKRKDLLNIQLRFEHQIKCGNRRRRKGNLESTQNSTQESGGWQRGPQKEHGSLWKAKKGFQLVESKTTETEGEDQPK